MTAKSYWKKHMKDFISLSKKQSDIKSFKIFDYTFQALPGVFSPKYSSDTTWFAKKVIPLLKNKTFLEIGGGTGAIGCLAALYGARKVVVTDINPVAVKNTQINAKNHALKLIARQGNLFQPIKKHECFDVIFWNHPFYFAERDDFNFDTITLSVCDREYQYLKIFFQEGKQYLTKNGQLVLGSSNIARINLIKQFAKEAGYRMKLLDYKKVPVYKGRKIEMELRIYIFTKDFVSK